MRPALPLGCGIWRKASCWPRDWFPRNEFIPLARGSKGESMAELEIHQEHEVDKDPAGKKVGVLAAVLAVFLAMVTIESHRAHTAGILLKTEANDQWNFYQAKRIKSHNLELGEDLIALLAPKGDGTAAKKLEEYRSGVQR